MAMQMHTSGKQHLAQKEGLCPLKWLIISAEHVIMSLPIELS